MQLVIGDVIRRNALAVPTRPAATFGEDSSSHRQLDADSNRLAHALAGLGVRHGDRVLVWADTSLDVLTLFAATSKLGAALAPLNARLNAEEAAPVAQLARAAILITDQERSEAGAAVAQEAGIALLAQLRGRGPGHDLAELSANASASDYVERALGEGDPHTLFFTSGSTGTPKGVVISHRANWLRGFQGVYCDVPQRVVCMFPLFHMAGFTMAMGAWQTGGEVILSPADPARILSEVERRSANRLYLLPSVYARLLELDTSSHDLSSLVETDTGTSAVPIELVEGIKERFPGCALRTVYGSTEAGMASLLADADCLRKPGSVGLPPHGVERRLADDGEILVRGPFLMDGYFDDPDATETALAGGWFHTGDLGSLDDDGYLSIVGRKKEIIRTGGESVSPTEVEAVLTELPQLADVAVVGLPDERWGEVVTAVIVAKPNAAVTLEELQQHCASRLAGFKKPRRLELVDSLPRTAATNQLQRTLVVQRLLTG